MIRRRCELSRLLEVSLVSISSTSQMILVGQRPSEGIVRDDAKLILCCVNLKYWVYSMRTVPIFCGVGRPLIL